MDNEPVLVIDDEESVARGFQKVLTANGFAADMATGPEEGLEIFGRRKHPVVVVDIMLGKANGLDLVEKILHKSPRTSIIMITGYPSTESAVRSFRNGAFEFLEKPCEGKTLVDTVRRAAQRVRDAGTKNETVRTLMDPAWIMHEIRAGLNLMAGYSELLGETQLDREQKQYLERMKTGQTLLTDLSNNILDFAKIESGTFALDESDFDMEFFIAEIVALIMPAVDRRGLKFGLSMHESVPRHVRGDPARLRQILVNLFNNALKFTEKGRIALRMYARPERGARYAVTFKIVDTGAGMPPEKATIIFDPFVQAHANTAKRSGTGLGLFICRTLVEKMDGRIACDSKLNKGTMFEFTVRLGRGAPGLEAEAAPAAFADLEGKSFVTVNVRPEIRRILEGITGNFTVNWTHYDNSGAMARHFPRNVFPDLVFVQAESTGEELIRSVEDIREVLPRGKPAGLVLMTFERRIGIAKEARQCGFDGFLPAAAARERALFVNFCRVMLGMREHGRVLVTRHLVQELALKGVRLLLAGKNTGLWADVESLHDSGCRIDTAVKWQDALNLLQANYYDACVVGESASLTQVPEYPRLAKEASRNRSVPFIVVGCAVEEKTVIRGIDGVIGHVGDSVQLRELLTDRICAQWKT